MAASFATEKLWVWQKRLNLQAWDIAVVVSRASTYDNAKNLDKAFQKQLESYKGSKLYQQEVLGEIVEVAEPVLS